MKIILLEDVKKHGKKGDIITVKDGFGMNYLIKNNLGMLANETGMKILNTEKKNKAKEDEESKKQALDIANKLKNITLTFKVKTGKEDKVFGSISPKQIEEELKKKKIIIDKRKIKIDHPVASLGTHLVKAELYKDVIGEIKVELTKESR
ncbi:MAG: 50S ribosomal protein L9 [Bacilli bacterium]|nr:50S ribosomal protein L9 [Bacilli bacterium]